MPPLTLTVPTRSRARHRLRAVVVAGEHRARQAVRRVVGDAHRVVVTVVGDDGQHRAEDLLAGHLGVVVQAGDDGRLDEEAGVRVGGTPTAAGEPAALLRAPRSR